MHSLLSFQVSVTLQFSLHVVIKILDNPRFSLLSFLDLSSVNNVTISFRLLLDGLNSWQVDQITHFFLQLMFRVILSRAWMSLPFCRFREEAGFDLMIMKLPIWCDSYASKCFMIVYISPIGFKRFILCYWAMSAGETIKKSRLKFCCFLEFWLKARCLGIRRSLICM